MRGTRTEETYTAINELVDGGTRLADAVRQIAAETGRSAGAVRTAYYAQRRKLGRHGRSRTPISVEDALQQARQLLQDALARIDEELAAAKAQLDAATARYETLETSAAQRKAELERKIAALQPDQ
jgi:chromosome segregation ATPase